MIKRIIGLMNERKYSFFTAVTIFCILEIFSSIVLPLCVKGITNGVVQLDSYKVTMSILAYAGVWVSWWILPPFCQILLDRNYYQTMKNFKCSMSEHLVKLPIRYFDNTPTGEIISKVTNDMSCLGSMIAADLQYVLRKPLGGIAGLLIMLIIDYRFALIVMALGSISIYTTKYFTEQMEQKSKSLLEQQADTSSNFMEIIKACKNIRILGCQEQNKKTIADAASKEKQFRIENGSINAKMNSIILAIDITIYLVLVFVGCLFVYNSWADWGSIIALISMKTQTEMLFSEFPAAYGSYKNNMAGVKRLFALYDLKEEENVTRKYLTKEEGDKLALKLENISFSYDRTVNVLDDLNMEIEKNKITLIEGESGKGKSTIIKLILGLYNASSGHILFNRDCQSVAYVPQEAQLYCDTIYENISCGNENSTEEDVYQAAKQAGVDEFVGSLKDGYNTVLNDDGNSLSGGQKQRISIARALVKNSDILLLDEITSSLDKTTEEKILWTIKKISEKKTVIFVTHSENVIRYADNIIRLS